jgi:methionyl-tRNA formyltransferase
VRVVFWGTPEPAVPALEAFLADPGTEVLAVVTNPDRPGGRGHRLRPPPVKVVAEAAGARVLQPARPADLVDELERLGADAGAVVAYGALLPPAVLATARVGFVNLHFSLLPAWRGAAPVAHTILAGERRTGVTCFILDEGMDTGPVLATAATEVRADDTAGALTARLARRGAPLLVEAVRGLVAGALEARAQDPAGATYAPKIRPDDARLDWSQPGIVVDRAVRAFNPVPGAHTTFGGARLKVHRGTAMDGDGAPGTVIRLDAGGPVVACGEGAYRLDEVQPAGKPRMSGRDFANGHRPLGARLGHD